MRALRRSDNSDGGSGRAPEAYRFPRTVSLAITCIIILSSADDLIHYVTSVRDLSSFATAAGVTLGIVGGALAWWFPRAGAVLGWIAMAASGLVTNDVGTVLMAFAGVTIAVTATATMRFLLVNVAVLLLEVVVATVRWKNVANLFWAWTLLLGVSVGVGFVIRAVLNAAAQRRVQAIAMERVQREAEGARRSERERIARDMHDYVAHELTLIVTSLAAARAEDLARPETVHRSERDQRLLDLIQEESHKALGELRGVLRVLKEDVDPGAEPPRPATSSDTRSSSDMGLPVAEGAEGDLTQVVQAAAQDLRLVGDDVDVSIVPWDRVPDGLSAEGGELLHRFMTEGATNALKHGGRGARVWIEAGHDDGGIHASITNTLADRPVPKGESTGLGLAGLRARAEEVGGSFTAGRARRDGVDVWCLSLALPLLATRRPGSGKLTSSPS